MYVSKEALASGEYMLNEILAHYFTSMDVLVHAGEEKSEFKLKVGDDWVMSAEIYGDINQRTEAGLKKGFICSCIAYYLNNHRKTFVISTMPEYEFLGLNGNNRVVMKYGE